MGNPSFKIILPKIILANALGLPFVISVFSLGLGLGRFLAQCSKMVRAECCLINVSLWLKMGLKNHRDATSTEKSNNQQAAGSFVI
jgi:hypothetical protein